MSRRVRGMVAGVIAATVTAGIAVNAPQASAQSATNPFRQAIVPLGATATDVRCLTDDATTADDLRFEQCRVLQQGPYPRLAPAQTWEFGDWSEWGTTVRSGLGRCLTVRLDGAHRPVLGRAVCGGDVHQRWLVTATSIEFARTREGGRRILLDPDAPHDLSVRDDLWRDETVASFHVNNAPVEPNGYPVTRPPYGWSTWTW